MNQPTQSAPIPSVEAKPAPRAPNTDGIWYASYPPDVPHEIDVRQYESIV